MEWSTRDETKANLESPVGLFVVRGKELEHGLEPILSGDAEVEDQVWVVDQLLQRGDGRQRRWRHLWVSVGFEAHPDGVGVEEGLVHLRLKRRHPANDNLKKNNKQELFGYHIKVDQNNSYVGVDLYSNILTWILIIPVASLTA